MSYSRSLIVGWYAEFKPTEIKLERGEKEIKFCPTSKKHSTNGNFCSVCGSKFETEIKKQYSPFPQPLHILEITDPVELNEYTDGLVIIDDLKILKGSRAVFPEFIGTKNSIIFAPGYKIWSDLGDSDGFVSELEKMPAPSLAWFDAVKKVFYVNEVEVKYGLVFELW